MPLLGPTPLDVGWWGDASTSFGVGVAVGPFWGVWAWAPGFCVGPHQTFDIGWAEALAVELGLQMADHHGLLDNIPPSSSRVRVLSDNMGIVAVLSKGRSRSANTNNVLKRIYHHLARRCLSLVPEYVASRDNVTDALSRGDIPAFLEGFPSAHSRSSMPTPSHLATFVTQW